MSDVLNVNSVSLNVDSAMVIPLYLLLRKKKNIIFLRNMSHSTILPDTLRPSIPSLRILLFLSTIGRKPRLAKSAKRRDRSRKELTVSTCNSLRIC